MSCHAFYMVNFLPWPSHLNDTQSSAMKEATFFDAGLEMLLGSEVKNTLDHFIVLLIIPSSRTCHILVSWVEVRGRNYKEAQDIHLNILSNIKYISVNSEHQPSSAPISLPRSPNQSQTSSKSTTQQCISPCSSAFSRSLQPWPLRHQWLMELLPRLLDELMLTKLLSMLWTRLDFLSPCIDGC